MLDNSKLPEIVKQGLRTLTYDEKVKIFDKNCAGCSFSVIKTVVKNRVVKHTDIDEAIKRVMFAKDGNAKLLRSCCFGNEDFSLTEITSNTCRLWYKGTCESDEGEFIELSVERIDWILDHYHILPEPFIEDVKKILEEDNSK